MTAAPTPFSFPVCQGDRSDTVEAARHSVPPPPAFASNRVALRVPDSVLAPAALQWLHMQGRQGALLPAELEHSRALDLAAACGCSALLQGDFADGRCHWEWHAVSPSEADCWPSATPGLLLLTSGSTGEPKRVFHSWESLFDSVAIRPNLAGSCWMTLYPLSRFAGLNTLLHAWLNRARMVIPSAFKPSVLAEHMVRWQPTHLSGTPTLWRTLLMQVSRSEQWRAQVLQITLGGEIVDQPILQMLAACFPQARLTHIYASTEAGVCISVSDGLAGFPAAWLDDASRPVQLRLDSGELFVRRTGARSLTLDRSEGGWWPTRDRIHIEGDRAFFLGRDSDLINVGGAKVAPSNVEACICAVEGVLAARVFGKKSSFAGSIVAAQVISSPAADSDLVRLRILQYCRERLPSYAVPRMIEFVHELPVSTSGKLDRQGI